MADTKGEQTARLAFRMTAIDAAMLAELAAAERESVSTVLRQLVRKEYTARFGDKRPKVRK